jgi:hypothetical protein
MSVMTVREGSIGGWSIDGPPFVDIGHESRQDSGKILIGMASNWPTKLGVAME